MKKTLLSLAIVGALGATATSVSASTLSIDAGSMFEMEVSPGFFLPTTITGFEGVITNDGAIPASPQIATGSHSGAPDGTESPTVDNPWSFFGNTGMHGHLTGANILSVSGNTASIDMSGWYVTWNGIDVIPMGSGAWGGNADGVGDITCAASCLDGETYSLAYTATVPVGDPSSFGGVAYRLTLNGTISGGDLAPVPVPAAVWLFGTGLIGLVGVARRRSKA